MAEPKSTPLAFLVVLPLLICACGCSTVSLENPYDTEYDPQYGMNEEDILTHFNLHRGRWWNHYARGTWLLAGGHYRAAHSDFATAIKERFEDKADARTYGMHFRDYFPHRESGIAFYLQGERQTDFATKEKLFGKAIAELEKSMQHEASSRAKFYLRRATAGYWGATKADATPPILGIANSDIDRWADVPTLYTDRFAVALDIRASDGQSGVATVSIDDEGLFIESIEKDFNEPAVVAIDPQQRTRTVTIKAVDLAGNESWPATVRLVVDTIPPTATIRVNPDNKTLFGEHIPVEISATDDRGLKSVQVGEEPYDSRDCRGESEWRGVFYAKPGTVELPVSVSDSAGNVTAASIRIEPEQLSARQPNRYAFANPPSLGYDRGRWNGVLAHVQGHSFAGAHVLGVYPTTYASETIYSPALAQRLVSDRVRRPVPRLVFPDFRGTRIVRTSNDSYLLQGEVRHANGLVDIEIVANDEVLESRREIKKGDYVIFCEYIPLPDYAEGKPLSTVTVQASFQDGTVITEPNLHVERVSDYISEPDSVYAVALLPLEQKHIPADPNDQHKDPNMAHDTVLEVLRTCRLHHPDDPNRTFRRFNCDALEGWDANELSRLRAEEGSAEKTFAALETKYALEARHDDTPQPSIELGFFGEIREDAKSIEIILRVINVKGGKLLFSRIDIFGNKDDYDWCRKGLVSKLQKAIRRVYGEVSCGKRRGDIVIDRGRSDGVFRNMDVNLYRPLKNGGLHPLTPATIKEVRRGDSTIQSTSTKLWNDVCDIDYGVKAIAISK